MLQQNGILHKQISIQEIFKENWAEMQKRQIFSARDMHLYSQYLSMNTNLPPLVDGGHGGSRIHMATVIMFPAHKVVAAAFA